MTQNFIIFFCCIQTSEECLSRINELEEQIISNLNENSESEDEDEKEEENLLNIYKKCKNLSEKTSKKLLKIDQKFKNLVLKMEKKLNPDEIMWQQWNGKQFRRFGFDSWV